MTWCPTPLSIREKHKTLTLLAILNVHLQIVIVRLCLRAALTEEAKLPGLLLHDFRRSAVRNMIPRGVPQKIAREISGHKTDSVFNRYNIVSEADLRDAARRIEAGAKTVVMHSECTVEPGRQPDQERQKEQKPIQSVS